MIGIKKTANKDINMGRVERVKKIVRLIVIFNLLMVGIYVYINGFSFKELLAKTGILITFSIVTIYIIDKYLWKFKILNFLFDSPPNIEGDWIGIIVNTNDGKEQKMTMEIKQTYLEVFITVNAERGLFTTYVGDIIKNNQNTWKLMWTWHANYKGKEFSGTTILDVINENKLKGFYFTNANIDGRGCTAGEFEAERVR